MRHFAIASMLALAGSAQAGYVGGVVEMQVEWNGQSWFMSSYPDQFTVHLNDDGSTTIIGHSVVPDGTWGMDYRLDVGGSATSPGRGFPSASVSANFTLVNAAAVTNTFVVTTTVPITIPFPNTGMRGSFSGSVLDNSASQNGATIAAPAGDSMYSALIDGGVVRTLRDDPFSVTAPGGLSQSIPTTNFGVPAFEAGPAAVNTISIRNRFTLTADDSATNSSTFIITPAPGAAALVGVAGLVGLRRRR